MKIEFNGNEILDIDKVKQTIEDTNQNTQDISDLKNEKVFSETVKEIKVVNEYPATEENGVLYIKLESIYLIILGRRITIRSTI